MAKGKKGSKPRHGVASRYFNHGCRCIRCTKAFAKWYRERAAKEERKCTIPGCDERLYCKGMCKPHYERDRLGLSVLAPVKIRPQTRGRQPAKDRK